MKQIKEETTTYGLKIKLAALTSHPPLPLPPPPLPPLPRLWVSKSTIPGAESVTKKEILETETYSGRRTSSSSYLGCSKT